VSATGDASDDDPPLFTPRRERRMTRAHAVLWGIILAATVADVLLTMVGLAGGFREGNALVRYMVSTFGPAGLWIVKFAAMCWLVAGWSLLSDRNATVFLALFAVVTLLVVVNNAVVVLGV
jgi:hypothetical protein